MVSTDLFYDRPTGARDRWLEMGATAVELETATVLALAGRRGLSAAAVLLAVDLIGTDGSRDRLAPEQLRAGERRLGELAARALSV